MDVATEVPIWVYWTMVVVVLGSFESRIRVARDGLGKYSYRPLAVFIFWRLSNSAFLRGLGLRQSRTYDRMTADLTIHMESSNMWGVSAATLRIVMLYSVRY